MSQSVASPLLTNPGSATRMHHVHRRLRVDCFTIGAGFFLIKQRLFIWYHSKNIFPHAIPTAEQQEDPATTSSTTCKLQSPRTPPVSVLSKETHTHVRNRSTLGLTLNDSWIGSESSRNRMLQVYSVCKSVLLLRLRNILTRLWAIHMNRRLPLPACAPETHRSCRYEPPPSQDGGVWVT